MYIAFTFLLLLFTSLAYDAGIIKPRERDVIKKEYAVRPGGTLRVEMDRGSIEVEICEEDRVFIELERIVKEVDKAAIERILELHEYAFDKVGNDVHVSTQFNSERSRWTLRKRSRLKVNLVVCVPAEYNVNFANGAGNVAVMDLGGFVDGTTGAGNITLSDIVGEVSVSSGAGNIDISGDVSAAEVDAGAGNIEIFGLRGAVSAATGVGNIKAVILHQPDSDSKLTTGAGNVVVELAEDVSVFIRASTSLGSANCEFPLRISKGFGAKSFSGEINGGGTEIEMNVGVGSVTLKRYY